MDITDWIIDFKGRQRRSKKIRFTRSWSQTYDKKKNWINSRSTKFRSDILVKENGGKTGINTTSGNFHKDHFFNELDN